MSLRVKGLDEDGNTKDNRKIVNAPTVKDHFGFTMDHIMIVPLFGNKYRFTCADEAIKFIQDIPKELKNEPATFAYVEIIIYYENGSKCTMMYTNAEQATQFIAYIFDIK